MLTAGLPAGLPKRTSPPAIQWTAPTATAVSNDLTSSDHSHGGGSQLARQGRQCSDVRPDRRQQVASRDRHWHGNDRKWLASALHQNYRSFQKQQVERRKLYLNTTNAKLDKFDLITLDELAYVTNVR